MIREILMNVASVYCMVKCITERFGQNCISDFTQLLQIIMKSKLTLFTLLAHITSLVVNNESVQVNTQTEIYVCGGNL